MSVYPFTVSFMLACQLSPGNPEARLGAARWNCEAGRQARQWLLDNGLIDHNSKATERGEWWVKDICATPLRIPTTTWTLPPRQPTVEEDWVKEAAE